MYRTERQGAFQTFGRAIGLALILTAATAAQAGADQPLTAAQPTSTAVLKAIYGKDSQGASNFDVGQGRYASYWYPYSFSLGGVSYFTGFAYNTPASSPSGDDMPGPDTKVTITEATFKQAGAGAPSSWSLLGVQNNVGQFGGNGKGNQVDKTQAPPSYRTPAGKLVLAIPGWYLDSGSRIFSYELFVFDPHLAGKNAAYWSYLGNVDAGEDNSAACGSNGGTNVPCVKSHGELSFASNQGNDMPAVHVSWSGTDLDTSGHLRNLGPSDAVDYRYNDTGKVYEKATR
jgi:hypothetical protein